jgi:hypothetical protein
MLPLWLRIPGFLPAFHPRLLPAFLLARNGGRARRRLVGIQRHQRSRLIRGKFLADFAC